MEGRRAIPIVLMPLFGATTAHQSINAAISMVTRANPEKQKDVLKDPLFQKAVLSALADLDECRDKHTQQFIDSFAPETEKNDLTKLAKLAKQVGIGVVKP